MRSVRVEAREIHSADGEETHASVTSLSRSKGDSEMRVSDDMVECLTNDDIDYSDQ